MEVFLWWQCTNTNMLYKQTDWITEQLEHVLEKGSAYRWQIARDNNGVRTEMTSAWDKNFCKMMNLIPRQCEMKTIIEEPASTGKLHKEVIRSLFTCYFVNTPLLLGGGSRPVPFCRKPVLCELIMSLYTKDSNYVRKIGSFKLTIELFDIYTVYPFFCPLVYMRVHWSVMVHRKTWLNREWIEIEIHICILKFQRKVNITEYSHEKRVIRL